MVVPTVTLFGLDMYIWIYAVDYGCAQTLDAVDGKQARRTNSSSPLGQLFDHGCDSFSTVSVDFVPEKLRLTELSSLSHSHTTSGIKMKEIIAKLSIAIFAFYVEVAEEWPRSVWWKKRPSVMHTSSVVRRAAKDCFDVSVSMYERSRAYLCLYDIFLCHVS